MQPILPRDIYQQQLQKHNVHLQQLLKKRSSLGWLRLAVFVATVIVARFIFISYGLAGLLPVVLGLGLLLYLVSADVLNGTKIKNLRTLIQINEDELRALDNHYTDRANGLHFLPAEHAYAADLDIFCPSSIYQWLNRCYTEQGQALLAQNLLHPLSQEHIALRQQAVKEITPQIEWRQQWQAYAMQTEITLATEKRIIEWAATEEKHFIHPAWRVVVVAYSIITLASALAAITGYIPGTVFSSLFLLYLITSTLAGRNAAKPYSQLNGIAKETATLQQLISWLEAGSFSSPLLTNLQSSIKQQGAAAGREIKNLKTILDRFDMRASIVGVLFFNSFLLWDVRQIIALNNWRKKNKAFLSKWFEAVAETEVIHSISTLHFNQPGWCLPEFVSTYFTLHGKNIGHPLLPAHQRVTNDFTLEGIAKIGLITGSNMAGKSTFLRSLGVNIVLAQAGAPVCATEFFLSPVRLVSSMRIADNLAENTSTFYAELKKLRNIIELVKLHQPVLILLDEILRGTNSLDRHKGSVALLKQLIKEDAVAVIATHDVELAQIQTTHPRSIDNYHFDVEVEGEELYFDYKIKPGICKSLNASILMKKIGIDLE